MELILFLFEVVLAVSIMRILLRNRVKPIFIVKNKVKYEIIMAVYVISIAVIIIKVFEHTSFNYLGGIILGVVQGVFEKICVYKKKESV